MANSYKHLWYTVISLKKLLAPSLLVNPSNFFSSLHLTLHMQRIQLQTLLRKKKSCTFSKHDLFKFIILTHTHTHTHTQFVILSHTHIHKHTHIHTHTHMHTLTHTCTHTHIRAHTHICTHLHHSPLCPNTRMKIEHWHFQCFVMAMIVWKLNHMTYKHLLERRFWENLFCQQQFNFIQVRRNVWSSQWHRSPTEVHADQLAETFQELQAQRTGTVEHAPEKHEDKRSFKMCLCRLCGHWLITQVVSGLRRCSWIYPIHTK